MAEDVPPSIHSLTPPPDDVQALNAIFETTRWAGWTHSERTRDLRAWVWAYGYDIEKDRKDRHWLCKLCVQKRCYKPAAYKEKGTANMMDHLFKSHQIVAPASQPKGIMEKRRSSQPPGPAQRSIVDGFKLDVSQPRDQAIANMFIKSFNRSQFRRLLVQYIVSSNRPFTEAENPMLRQIFEYLNPAVTIQNAHLSGEAIRNKIVSEFEKHSGTIATFLSNRQGLVHISFDGWTAKNQLPLYGIACFCRDNEGKPVKLILGTPEISQRHTGINIAQVVYNVLERFHITDKIGYAILDNATNNDTAIAELGDLLGFYGASRRGRCFGHILNLTAKALLFAPYEDGKENNESGGVAGTECEWRLWCKRGPVG